VSAGVTAAPAAARPAVRRVSPGLRPLLRAEWVKFRSVRGWLIGMLVAAVITVLFGVFVAGNASIGCQNGPNQPVLTGKACLPYVATGPGGEAVTDSFYFVRQPLAGNGSITVRVDSLTGRYAAGNGGGAAAPGQGQGPAFAPGLQPWSKAGIIIKASTAQGSAYAAMMVTGTNGVRMQYDYTHDTAGLAGLPSATAPRWLRLTRAGDVITGYDSTDGTHWHLVGTATLAGLTGTVQAGLFATSPQYTRVTSFGTHSNVQGGPSQATGHFSQVRLIGGTAGGTWTGQAIGGGSHSDVNAIGGGWQQSAGVVTVTGSGDIAPIEPGPGAGVPTATFEQSLTGLFAGLIAIIVVATMFMTAEYRRGLIRVTLAASPHRGRMLAAKAAVAGAVTFVVTLIAAAACVLIAIPRQRNEGLYVLPVPLLTELRVLAGAAALAAVVAVLAVALGTMLRRSSAAITVGIAVIVLPFFLSVAVLPAAAGDWLLRLSPAAGFAVEQSIPHYSQVTNVTDPAGGWYPLPPLAGFLVTCAWAAAALLAATFLLRRRDA